jgi:hypothetical protein
VTLHVTEIERIDHHADVGGVPWRSIYRRSGQSALLEDFYWAMRYDLGHSNKGLARGDILRLVTKRDDIEELLANMKTDPSYRLKQPKS